MSINILNKKNKIQNTQNIDNIKISDLSKKNIFSDYYNEKCKENVLLRLNKIKELSNKNNNDFYTKNDITNFCKCSLKKISKYKVNELINLIKEKANDKLKNEIQTCTFEVITLKNNKKKTTKKGITKKGKTKKGITKKGTTKKGTTKKGTTKKGTTKKETKKNK